MKNSLIILLIFNCLNLKAQSFSDFIKQNSIEVSKLDTINDLIFERIKDQKCILLGEMHGTEEPAKFLTGLVKTLVKNNKKVLLGLEIPSSDMIGFTLKKTKKQLTKTNFFSVGEGDGRNSKAWFQLILSCSKLKNVDFCFFDFKNEKSNFNPKNRDSLMFCNLKSEYLKDTSRIIVALSGNIHNKIELFRGEKTFGCFAKDYFLNDKIMSISCQYDSGTMHNRTYEGLKIREIKGQGGAFLAATNMTNFFLFKIPKSFTKDYSAILFTKFITASVSIEQ